MHTRRHVIKVSLLGGITASLGRVVPAFARAESTPEAEPWVKNGILTKGIDDLPRAEDGEITGVAWAGGDDGVYMLIHNATSDELIMREGNATARDATGNVVSESDNVDSAPYSLAPDSYGLNSIRFASDIAGATDIVLDLPTEPITEATGALMNLDVVSLEHKNDRVAKVVVKNISDVTLDSVPIIGVYFDDSMAIVGGTFNPIIGPLHPGSEGSLSMHTWWGVKTDRYLIAAFGSGRA